MRIRLLGTVSALGANGAELLPAGPRLRGLLARLALDAGRPVDAATLVDALWGEQPPSTANALQSLATRLRRAIGPDRVRTAPHGYRLDIAPDAVDALHFAELRRTADSEPNDTKACVLLEQALALWAGPALADLRELAFADPAAARLGDARAAAAEELARRGLADGVPVAGRETLTSILAEQPLRETTAVALARGLHASGRRADGLAVLDRTRAALADELGVDPGPELRRARTELLHDAPSRDSGPPNASVRGGEQSKQPAGPPYPGEQSTQPSGSTRPGEQSTQPGVNTADRAPARHRSPALTSFVGRTDDLARIRMLLPAARLVTVLGPGGAGKTRIVAEVVRDLDREVAVAELAPLTGTDQVVTTVLHAVGGPDLALGGSGGPDLHTRLRTALAGRELLLVLDNCEHLIDAAAGLVHDLLTSVSGLTVLATSREPLGVPGEVLHPLDALDDEQAVRLFTDRAAAVVPGFSPERDGTDVVAQICRRLDGQPLPIELAAARVRTLSVGEIADRLADRFRLLVTGSRTALPRHQTLRAVVDWSWDLLTDDERVAATRFGVFAGAVDARAVEAVCGDGDLIDALVDKSFVVAVRDAGGGPTRYRMLETIREYAADRLAAASEAGDVLTAHAEWVLGVLETAEPALRTAAQLEWLGVIRRIEGEAVRALDNAVAGGRTERAHRLLAGLVWSWQIRGDLPSVRHWSDRVAELPEPGPGPATAVVRAFRAMVLAAFTDGAGVQDEVDVVIALRDRLPRPLHPAVALTEPIWRAFHGLDVTAPAALATDVTGDPWTRAAAAAIAGGIAENNGDLGEHRRFLRIAHRLFHELGDRYGLGMTLSALAELEDVAGDRDAAMATLTEAVVLSEELGSDDVPQLRVQLAGIAARSGDADGAREQLRLADAAQHLVDMPTRRNWMFADVERRLGRLERAGELLRSDSQHPVPNPGRRQRDAAFQAITAAVALDSGDLDAARVALQIAADAAADSLDGPVTGQVAEISARYALAVADPERAGELLGVAVAQRGALNLGDPEVVATRDGVVAALGPDGADAALARGRAIPRDVAPRP